MCLPLCPGIHFPVVRNKVQPTLSSFPPAGIRALSHEMANPILRTLAPPVGRTAKHAPHLDSRVLIAWGEN
jgi:hypothetical protein